MDAQIAALENGVKYLRTMIAFSDSNDLEFYLTLQATLKEELAYKKRQNDAQKLLAILKGITVKDLEQLRLMAVNK